MTIPMTLTACVFYSKCHIQARFLNTNALFEVMAKVFFFFTGNCLVFIDHFTRVFDKKHEKSAKCFLYKFVLLMFKIIIKL